MNGFDKSESFFSKALKVMPGGVSSNNRSSSKPFPLFYSHGIDSRIYDVDGNSYIDYMLGRGPLILGHSPRKVMDALKNQIDQGLFFAGQTEKELLLAEKLVEIIPSAEMVRFCNTGSEAVHAALKLSRSATGRKKIIKFQGHYHGWYDNIAWGFGDNLSSPMSLGQSIEDSENLIIIPWNDISSLENAFNDFHKEIAAVITEPVMYNGFFGGIFPEDGFLNSIRELCNQNGSLLIFDEIITGFRFPTLTAQQNFDVVPDLSTFAKAMGGGVPISVVVGKEKYMSRFYGANTVHTGTYNAYPPSINASLATIETLTKGENYLLKSINEKGRLLKSSIKDIFDGTDLPAKVMGIGAAFTICFNAKKKVCNANDALHSDRELLGKLVEMLQMEGIRISPEGLLYISAAHSDEDIKQTIAAFEKVISRLKKD